MDPLTLVLAQHLAVLNAMKTAGPPGGPLNGAVLHLAVGVPGDIVSSTIGQWDEADFTGYSSAAIAFGSAYVSPLDGKAYISAPSHLFLSAAPAGAEAFVANTLNGWYLTDAAGTNLLGGGRLSEPVAIVKPDQGVEVGVDLPYGG